MPQEVVLVHQLLAQLELEQQVQLTLLLLPLLNQETMLDKELLKELLHRQLIVDKVQ